MLGISMVTSRDDLITLTSTVVLLRCFCILSVFLSGRASPKMGQTSVGENQAGNSLASLLVALLMDVPCATLCTMNAFSFPIKIDQHD